MEILRAGAEKLGLSITEQQLEQFEDYYRELTDWNKRRNLTSITGYEDVQVDHFLDSITIIPAIQKSTRGKNPRIIDVGTGAGMPGIPVKVLLPDVRLTLLEATAKKVEFLCHIRRRLGLDDVEIIAGRAEDVAHQEDQREAFDLVLSRAVAPLATLVELTLPFCKTGGIFIAQKKRDIKQELEEAEKAINTLGGRLREIKTIELPEFDDERCLIIIDKIAETSSKYPRRPGIPAKRPLKER
jgi:16S rRNA (guanine527-N7)-methyltransferase